MTIQAKQKAAKRTNIALTVLTAISAFGAALGTLPMPSHDLPIFSIWPEARPYVMSAGYFGIAIRLIANSIRDALK